MSSSAKVKCEDCSFYDLGCCTNSDDLVHFQYCAFMYNSYNWRANQRFPRALRYCKGFKLREDGEAREK